MAKKMKLIITKTNKKMEKKNYEVTMVIECEEGAEKHIAQSVCDGLEEPTCVKHINIKETKTKTK